MEPNPNPNSTPNPKEMSIQNNNQNDDSENQNNINNSNNKGGEQESLTNLMTYVQDNDHRESDLFRQAAVLQQLFNQQQQLQQQQQQQQQQRQNHHQQHHHQQEQQQQEQQQQQQQTNIFFQQQNSLSDQGIPLRLHQALQQANDTQPDQDSLYQPNLIQGLNLVSDQQQQEMQFQLLTNPFALNQVLPRDQQQQQQQPAQRPFNGRSILNERECFFIFIKILMKLTANNPRLRSRAKAVISECTRKNRMGDMEYIPLQSAVERRLKGSIGELNWARAKLYFDAYCERNGIQQPMTLAPVAPV